MAFTRTACTLNSGFNYTLCQIGNGIGAFADSIQDPMVQLLLGLGIAAVIGVFFKKLLARVNR